MPSSSAQKVSVKFPEIEDKVTEWFFKYQHCFSMTGERARDDLDISDAEFKASTGWIQEILESYSWSDKYNMDETGKPLTIKKQLEGRMHQK
ncbi:hypothetical protein BGZ58_010773 [Dissophora ornata]|nr:hypothetical protein BGZ58_010773 [Dissophora ornata]